MLDQESEFRHRDLPKGVSFQLQLDSTDRRAQGRGQILSGGPPPAPQLAIAASGEGTPFRLTCCAMPRRRKAAVDGDALGKISLESPIIRAPLKPGEAAKRLIRAAIARDSPWSRCWSRSWSLRWGWRR
jgi:hypothetical protein